MNIDHLLSSYVYELPEELIAQTPVEERGQSRLLVFDRKQDSLIATDFSKLPDYLPPSLLVCNNSKVVPARISTTRETGGKAEFLLLTPLPALQPVMENGWNTASVECLLRPAGKIKPQHRLDLGKDMFATNCRHQEFGKCSAEIHWKGNLAEILERTGSLPLPPYIRRDADIQDTHRYQTIFSRQEKRGSVAAPTAGLHFTQQMHHKLSALGYSWAEVTLYVGYGTFSPVREQDIRRHSMHSEYIEITAESALAISEAKKKGIPVTAIGTTAARTLEGAFLNCGTLQEYTGWTYIFLYPGKKLHVVDHLLTNFHLPESTLLMLVAALTGREKILGAYRMAVEQRFRFFSYGDAMLIL